MDIPKTPTVEDLIKHFKKKDSLIIMGFASTSAPMAPIQDNSVYDIWGLNTLDALIPGAYTLMFNIHKSGIPKEHIGHMAASPLYNLMPSPHPAVPRSLAFPFDELIAMFGASYFSCTAAWQIALAIAMQYKRIDLWGIDMTEDKEYAYERPCVEYYIGIARGLGILVGIPDTSALCSAPFAYGISDIDAQPWRRMQTLVQQRLEAVEKDSYQMAFQQGRVEGAKVTLKFLMSAIRENTRVFDIMERETSAAHARVGGIAEMEKLALAAAEEGAQAKLTGAVPPVMPTLSKNEREALKKSIEVPPIGATEDK